MGKWINIDDLPSGRVEWEDIFDAPSIDIVRCGECKYYNARYFECECDWASTDHEGGASYSLDRNADDFCSYGEREDE